jgi:thioredoxin-like negative regulator of GroEL
MTRQLRRSTAALLALIAIVGVLRADEVRWRFDYTAARRESQQSGKPMLLDFSTEWCGPCRRLEKTTFRDPTVVQLLNEKFVPVKLDGSKEKGLVDLLQVHAYPTLILAGADGRILKNLEGFQDATSLCEHLREVFQLAATPARPAEKPEVKAEHRRQRAAELLAQAKNDYQNQQFLCCLDRCVLLVQDHADLPQAAEGSRMLEQIKANPVWMKSAADQLALRLAEIHLAMAENWISKGEVQLASECLERVTAIVPGTRYAETAKGRLAQIAGQAANQTSLRKP